MGPVLVFILEDLGGDLVDLDGNLVDLHGVGLVGGVRKSFEIEDRDLVLSNGLS